MDSVEEELLGCWAPWYVTPMALPESAMMRPVCALVPAAEEASNFTDLLRFIMRNSLVKCLFVCGRWAAGPEGHPRDSNAPKDLLIGASQERDMGLACKALRLTSGHYVNYIRHILHKGPALGQIRWVRLGGALVVFSR